ANSMQRTRTNRQAIKALAKRTRETYVAISEMLLMYEDQSMPNEWVQPATDLCAVVIKATETLQDLMRRSYFMQVLNQDKDSSTILGLRDDIQHAFDVFMLQASVSIQQKLKETQAAKTHRGARVLAELDEHSNLVQIGPDVPESGAVSNVPSLPGRPHALFGRDQELGQIMGTIDPKSSNTGSDPPRIIVLGPAGIGKTTLSLAVLHHETAVSRFGTRRIFVACDAAELAMGCLTALAANLGHMEGDKASLQKKIVKDLSSGETLLLLDNFETPWESPESRVEAEELLQLLAGIPSLTLVVTMRGAERPRGVAWTRPLLPQLGPLDKDAARQTFVDIADKAENDPQLWKLLDHLENVPLAVVLMANLAQYEDVTDLLSRWDAQHTSLLSRGQSRLSSLNVSIQLSLDSPRMATNANAQDLLALLSLLPDGSMDVDLQLSVGLSDVAKCTTILLQNALAYRTSEQRVRVLAPIRSFILDQYPPPKQLHAKFFSHYFAIATTLTKQVYRDKAQETVSLIGPEISNVEATISYAIDNEIELRGAITAVCDMAKLLKSIGGSSHKLLQKAEAKARGRDLKYELADCLYAGAILAWGSNYPGDPMTMFKEGLPLAVASGNWQAEVNCRLQLLVLEVHTDNDDRAIREAEDMVIKLEEQQNTWNLARCRQALMMCYRRADRKADAVRTLNKANAEMRAANNPYPALLGQNLCYLAEIEGDAGFFTKAIKGMREGVPELEKGRHGTMLAVCKQNIAILLDFQGEFGAAAVVLKEAVESFRGLTLSLPETFCLFLLSECCASLGDTHHSDQYLNEATQLVK
ncbi:hypothetical protein BKA62DRAFT_602207, partial [Auriculariales sp. MPI-PUGE-AT-0066]